jgi:hypothetical protein
MDKLLSDDEVVRLAGADSKVVTYPELQNYSSLRDLFGNDNKIIILYLNERNGSSFVGHWVLLLRRKDASGNTVIEFNDSYSNEVDEYFDDVPDGKRMELDQERGYLSKLILDYCRATPNAQVEYNEYPLQRVKGGVNTCGRWVGLRGHFSDIPLTRYQALFKKLKREGYNLDKVVVAVTDLLLKRK